MDSGDWLVRWEAAEAEWVTHGAVLIDLPAVAVDAMVFGWDSRSLRLLAGMSSHDDVRDVRETFLAAIGELGRDLPAADDAARRLVRLYATQIVNGGLSPIDGALAITRLGYDLRGEAGEQVMTFVALEHEATGQWGRPRAEVESAILHAAHDALRSSTPD